MTVAGPHSAKAQATRELATAEFPQSRSGGCLCGAVRFDAALAAPDFGACHCEMCRRWTGSALLGMPLPADAITWRGEQHIARIQSSDWVERGFCSRCGSGLFYRVTTATGTAAKIELPIGLLDDADGLNFTNEIYIDHKPDSYAYAGEGRKMMTRQDCVEAFGALGDE